MDESQAEGGEDALRPIFNRTPQCLIWFLVLWSATLLCHSWVLWQMIEADMNAKPINPVEPILYHVGIVTVLAIAVWQPGIRKCGRAIFVLLVGSTAFLGFVGIFGALLVFVLFLDYLRIAKPFDEWHEELFPQENRQISEELAERLQIASGDTSGNLSPFLDILSFGNQAQKLTMIALITRHFRPAFAPILLQAVNAPDNAIRVQAATAVSYVENRFMQQLMKLEKKLQDDAMNQKLLLQTARQFDEYAFSGLMDGLRAMEIRKKALHYYQRYLKLVPDDLNVVTAVGRVLIKNKNYQEAVEFMRMILERGVTNDQLIVWYMESLYQLGHYDTLNQIAQSQYAHFKRNTQFPIRIIESIHLWSRPTPDV